MQGAKDSQFDIHTEIYVIIVAIAGIAVAFVCLLLLGIKEWRRNEHKMNEQEKMDMLAPFNEAFLTDIDIKEK